MEFKWADFSMRQYAIYKRSDVGHSVATDITFLVAEDGIEPPTFRL